MKPKFVVMKRKEFCNPEVGPTGDIVGIPCTAWDTRQEAEKDISIQNKPKHYYIEEYSDEAHGWFFCDESELHNYE